MSEETKREWNGMASGKIGRLIASKVRVHAYRLIRVVKLTDVAIIYGEDRILVCKDDSWEN